MKTKMKKAFDIVALSMALLTVMMSMLLLCGCEQKDAEPTNAPDYLVLVNKDRLISSDYVNSIQLTTIDNVDGGTYEVEITTKEAFQELQSYLLEKGVEIGVDSAFRSVEDQQEIMDEFIGKYGEDYAKKTVAVPGTSEHHTGLAIDIVPKVNGKWVIENEDMLKETAIFEEIHRALPEYGFILRYPKGREDITGYDYEPWHIRYVGRDVAQKIYEQQIALEEYIL